MGGGGGGGGRGRLDLGCRDNLIQIFDMISTSEDMTGFSQLSTNFTLTLIVCGSRHDIENLNKISVSTLKTP